MKKIPLPAAGFEPTTLRVTTHVFLSQLFPPYGSWPPSVSPSWSQTSSQYPGGPYSGRQQATLA